MNEYAEYKNILIQRTIKSLEKNFFDVVFLKDKLEVLSYLAELIPSDSIVGYGGSRSLEEVGFFEHFTKEHYPNLLDRRSEGLTQDQKRALQISALSSDFFLCSVNALSMEGDLVFIDKWGNRNAAMTFGPKNRIVVVGKNKIEKTLSDALSRAQNVAAVLNNIRFNTKNPCSVQGHCVNCSSPDRLCSVTTIINRCAPSKSIKVIIVDENLGF